MKKYPQKKKQKSQYVALTSFMTQSPTHSAPKPSTLHKHSIICLQ
uniref:Uncharacterized protein LOC107421160 n=1 Tax=Rhizophora mucronata TaxID=61149 RepID=A0A2P2JVU4_RHIMU